MAKILITGSTDGLGQMAARSLINKGHQVVAHARNTPRAADSKQLLKGVADILIGDLSSLEETTTLGELANTWGHFDVVIHNAGVYRANRKLITYVNVLAPYILTCLIHQPKRLVYLSSRMHRGGSMRLDELAKTSPQISYSDSKMMILLWRRRLPADGQIVM